MPPSPRDVRTTEALERMLDEPGRKPLALVDDMKLHHPVAHAGAEQDRPHSVAQRVVDHVPERLDDASLVALELEVGTSLDADLASFIASTYFEPPGDAREEVSRALTRGLQREHSPIGARDEEKILRKQDEPIGLMCGRPQRAHELIRRSLPACRQIELGLEQGERRTELVTRVGDERPLALERGAEAVEISFSVSPSPLPRRTSAGVAPRAPRTRTAS